MNSEQIPQSIGWQLGADGVQSIVENVERYCNCEERRINLTNRGSILRSKAELSFLVEEEQQLADRLRHQPPPGDLRHLRRRAIYYWLVIAILTLAGFALTLLAFDPFRLGWKAWVYCLGIAIVTPFLVEKVLEHWNVERLIKAMAAIGSAAALASLMILAVIRGSLLAAEGATSEPAVTMDGTTPAPQPPAQTDFYAKTVPLLRWAMVLLALSMELAAGLALHKAWHSRSDNSEDWNGLRNNLVGTRTRMSMLVAEISGLEDEAGIFAAGFWRDFYAALLTNAAQKAITKLLMVVLAVTLLPHAWADSGGHLSLVIAIDLTKSVDVVGPDGKTEFQKNIDGVTGIIEKIPAGAHVAIIGITDHSFAQPYILLSASVSADAGYFGERLGAARNQLVGRWKARSRTLQPDSRSTDVFGALLLASQIFAENPPANRRMLVLFSDMRNSTSVLNLERFQVLSHTQTAALPPEVIHADLGDVEVYALGVDGANKPAGYWQGLQQFWLGYLNGSGAVVKSFSVLRDAPG
jgi:hypothetical protein